MSDPDPYDAFINGLRQYSKSRRPPQKTPLGGMPHSPGSPKGFGRGLTWPAACVIVVACSFVAFVCGGALTGSYSEHEPEVVTNTVTVTVRATEQAVAPETAPEPSKPTVPASCIAAIQNARRVLKQGSKLSSSTDKALDILSRANQAALRGSPAQLNAAVKDLRDLSDDLQADKVVVLLPYQGIMDGLATCPAS